MIRELFHIGGVTVSPFGLLLAIAFCAAYLQLSWGLRLSKAGDVEDARALVFAGALGGVLGAKLYYAILHGSWKSFFSGSGLVWYGGFVLGGMAVLWTIKRRGLPAWPTVDAVMPSLALGYGIGRVGCFLVGDDYGLPTDLPWAVVFRVGLPPTQAYWLRSVFGLQLPAGIRDEQLLAVHPTQLYETLLSIAVWAVGVWFLRRGFRPGTTALVVLALLSCERFGIEFLRVKDDRFFGALSLAQVISLAILASIFFLRRSQLDGSVAAKTSRRVPKEG